MENVRPATDRQGNGLHRSMNGPATLRIKIRDKDCFDRYGSPHLAQQGDRKLERSAQALSTSEWGRGKIGGEGRCYGLGTYALVPEVCGESDAYQGILNTLL